MGVEVVAQAARLRPPAMTRIPAAPRRAATLSVRRPPSGTRAPHEPNRWRNRSVALMGPDATLGTRPVGPSASDEFGIALLGEGAHGLAGVLGGEIHGLTAGL